MHRHMYVLIVLILVTLPGCGAQEVKDAWKGTKSYYYQYLNTPAKLNFSDKGDIEDYQAALGEAVADFDMHLIGLERALQNSDRSPDVAWATAMATRFPWISGLVLSDEYGTPQAKIPPNFPKPFDIGTLLDLDPKQQLKDLRAYVQQTHLGPEIYIGNPVYTGEDFRGVIIAHFDPRTLLMRTGDPSRVVIAGPDGVLWPGIYAIEETPLAGVNWREKVKETSYGIVSNSRGSFYWISRYVGNLPLVYAIRIKGDFSQQESNLAALNEASQFALGQIGGLVQEQEAAHGQESQGPTPSSMPQGPGSPGRL